MRYFIHIGFDGTGYSGWQRQKSTPNTVQQMIEQTLSRILKQTTTAYGCGRTDAGVHASQYVIQLDIDEAPAYDLKFRLNKNLPTDIAVYEIIEVEARQHCRYDATARTYDYFIHLKKDPILNRFSLLYEDISLDYDLMKSAATIISKTTNFRQLCKQPDLYKNTLCRITNCVLYVNEEQNRLRFTITSNRFLRGMIRYCVSILLKIGIGQMTIEEFQEILNHNEAFIERRPALPNGLFLSKVEYPFLTLNESNNLIKMLKVGLE